MENVLAEIISTKISEPLKVTGRIINLTSFFHKHADNQNCIEVFFFSFKNNKMTTSFTRHFFKNLYNFNNQISWYFQVPTLQPKEQSLTYDQVNILYSYKTRLNIFSIRNLKNLNCLFPLLLIFNCFNLPCESVV